LGISGTGVRNNFTTADVAVRKEGVQHIKEYVEVAARLGAPVIRVFADTQMRAENWQSVSKGASRAEVQRWIAGHLRECADHGLTRSTTSWRTHMKSCKSLFFTLLLICSLSTLAIAKQAPSRDQRLVSQLTLTPDQKSKLDPVLEDAAKKLRDLRTDTALSAAD